MDFDGITFTVGFGTESGGFGFYHGDIITRLTVFWFIFEIMWCDRDNVEAVWITEKLQMEAARQIARETDEDEVLDFSDLPEETFNRLGDWRIHRLRDELMFRMKHDLSAQDLVEKKEDDNPRSHLQVVK